MLQSRSTESPSLLLLMVFVTFYCLFFYIYIFILYVQQALTCVFGVQEGCFLLCNSPTHWCHGEEQQGSPLPFPSPPPPSCFWDRDTEEFPLMGQFMSSTVSTLHTTQRAKACQTVVSAHVRLFGCVWSLIYPSFNFNHHTIHRGFNLLSIISWEAVIISFLHFLLQSVIFPFPCFSFISYRSGKNGRVSLWLW